MPEPPSINVGEKAYRTLAQTLAWIADRSLDGVNRAYREWRDRYYEYPQLPDWRSKPPLIWDWRSPVDELDRAAQALRQKCETGALHGTGREGVGGPRREIASLRWPDLILADIAGMTAGPQLYDSSADPLAIMSGRVEPAFHDVLFVVTDLLKGSPAPGEAEEDPAPSAPKADALIEPAKTQQNPKRPKVRRRVRRTTLSFEAIAVQLRRLFPDKRPELGAYPMLLKSLEDAGFKTSPTTLKKAIKKLGPNWNRPAPRPTRTPG